MVLVAKLRVFSTVRKIEGGVFEFCQINPLFHYHLAECHSLHFNSVPESWGVTATDIIADNEMLKEDL